MRLQDIMNRKVSTVRPNESADRAWERMKAREIHHLVVMDAKKPVGVVSERDLGSRRGASLRVGKNVSELMTPQPVTAKPTTTLKQAANLLRGYGIGCLPVIEDGKLRGIVTIADILELLGRGIERPIGKSERSMMKRKGGRPTTPRR